VPEISIPSASETGLDLPDDLREVFRYARRHDCQFIYRAMALYYHHQQGRRRAGING